MPGKFDVESGKHTVDSVLMTDSVFCIHALAVIEVHNIESEKDKSYTLPKIMACDSMLHGHSDDIRVKFVQMFGRQCTPLLTAHLTHVFNMSIAAINASVGEQVAKINKVLAELEAKM